MITCGLYTAIITPFNEQGKLDEEAFKELIAKQNQAGVSGLVVMGATGEGAVLTSQERKKILKIAREEAGLLKIFAGINAYSTFELIETIKECENWGADGALVAPPCFIKPTQEGIRRHFEEACHQTKLPLLLYNHHGRTGVNIETETLLKLVELPAIVGVKEASGNLLQACDVLDQTKRKKPGFLVFSGDDPMTYPLMTLGADGVISVVSNLIPDAMFELVHALLQQEQIKARALHYRLLPLFKAIFLETNPIPIKAAMRLCGLPGGSPRLPLTPLNECFLPALEKVLEELDLLQETFV